MCQINQPGGAHVGVERDAEEPFRRRGPLPPGRRPLPSSSGRLPHQIPEIHFWRPHARIFPRIWRGAHQSVHTRQPSVGADASAPAFQKLPEASRRDAEDFFGWRGPLPPGLPRTLTVRPNRPISHLRFTLTDPPKRAGRQCESEIWDLSIWSTLVARETSRKKKSQAAPRQTRVRTLDFLVLSAILCVQQFKIRLS